MFILAKTALITGASQGIGACIALRLAQDGFNIAVNCRGEAAVSYTHLDVYKRQDYAL